MNTAELLQTAELFKNTLVAQATGDTYETGDYTELRRLLLSETSITHLLPEYVKKCRTPAEFWQYIKAKYGTYRERRVFIWEGFAGLFDHLEGVSQIPSEQLITQKIEKFGMSYVQESWDKATQRRKEDPEGAITASRTLIETVCKHILDRLAISYDEKADLPELYKTTAKNLNLSPENHQEEVFKQILSGCVSVVNGLGSLRNKLSDAHGKNTKYVKPSERHASLVVNLGGAMAMFLLETYEKASTSGGTEGMRQ